MWRRSRRRSRPSHDGHVEASAPNAAAPRGTTLGAPPLTAMGAADVAGWSAAAREVTPVRRSKPSPRMARSSPRGMGMAVPCRRVELLSPEPPVAAHSSAPAEGGLQRRRPTDGLARAHGVSHSEGAVSYRTWMAPARHSIATAVASAGGLQARLRGAPRRASEVRSSADYRLEGRERPSATSHTAGCPNRQRLAAG